MVIVGRQTTQRRNRHSPALQPIPVATDPMKWILERLSAGADF